MNPEAPSTKRKARNMPTWTLPHMRASETLDRIAA
jgi:hypothetical protein